MNDEIRSEVAFLDTNALHFLYLYLEYAREQDLYPFSPNENAVAEASEQLSGIGETNLKNSLGRGLITVDCLSKPGVRVEYSMVSELELMAGRARGRAVEKAAREGIPDRMWDRFSEREVNARLSHIELTEIRAGIEGLGTVLEGAGIIATVSNEGNARDVYYLAKGVAGLVYLGFADSAIYASALVAGADYLVSEDKYFRKIVNRIKNGPQPYDQVRQEVKTLVAQIILSDAGSVTLPGAPRLSLNRH